MGPRPHFGGSVDTACCKVHAAKLKCETFLDWPPLQKNPHRHCYRVILIAPPLKISAGNVKLNFLHYLGHLLYGKYHALATIKWCLITCMSWLFGMSAMENT